MSEVDTYFAINMGGHDWESWNKIPGIAFRCRACGAYMTLSGMSVMFGAGGHVSRHSYTCAEEAARLVMES